MNHRLIVAAALAVLVTAGCKGAKKAAEETSGPALVVAAADLIKDYKGNEVRGDGKYKGKRLQVTGVVGDIKKDFTDSIYVTLGTGAAFEFETVNCYFGDEYTKAAADLSKGASITVDCKCTGLVIASVVMKDCKFVGAPAAPVAKAAAVEVTGPGVCAKLLAAGVAKDCGKVTPGAIEQTAFGIASMPGKSGTIMRPSEGGFPKYAAMVNALPPTSALRPFVSSEKAGVVVHLQPGATPATVAKAKAVVDGL